MLTRLAFSWALAVVLTRIIVGMMAYQRSCQRGSCARTNFVKYPRSAIRSRVVAIAWSFVFVGVASSEVRTGEQIYRQLCVSCHGVNGEGTKEQYPYALTTGDRNASELTKYIDKAMPEDEPEKCVGEDARKVADYIRQRFGNRSPQDGQKPPRMEVARLTVRQYRHSVMDLIGAFRYTPDPWNDQRGLRGEYFKSRRFRDNERVLDRVDPEVKFDFGEASPEPGKLDPEEFAIRWQGSVYAPETGRYDFYFKTANGVRLWVNDREKPLIDGWVRSGEGARQESIWLLGGRAYPIRLELYKSKQAKDKKASIVLSWRIPGRVEEILSRRYLSPTKTPERYVVSTPFPPDDRSIGYERGSSISKAWDQATTDGAFETADYVIERLRELSGGVDAMKLRAFCVKFAERAFRRPLTDEQKQIYIERPFKEAPTPELAVKRVILLTLKSPRFLYPELPSDPVDGHTVASRLALSLWDTLPDDTLWRAAAAGDLKKKAGVQERAKKMLADTRAKAKIHEFLLQWLKVDHIPDVSKDSKRYPEFNANVAADLRTSLELFLEDVVWSEASDFRQLLTTDAVYLNGRLAKLYGANLPADADFKKVTIDGKERAGIFSHPYLMAGFAYTSTSSPIHRGVFVARSVLGRSLRPPPEAVAPLAVELHADLTTRERVQLQTKPEACQSCHSLINPLGFAMENFDAIGRFRKTEQGKPVNATGAYQTRSGETQKFTGVNELAAFLADNDETHAAFVDQLFHYLVKQPIRAFGPNARVDLRSAFRESQLNIRKLIVEIVTTAALTTKSPTQAVANK